MGLKEDLEQIRDALRDETTKCAERIQVLFDRLANESISPAQKAELKSAFQAEIDRLKSLGVDPNEPVPPEPPMLMKARAQR